MNEHFRNWLISSKKLGARSAGNVLSHLKRVSSFVDVSPKFKTDRILYDLSQQDEFRGLSYSVRSQLRRSVKLYHLFLQNKG